MAGYSSLAPSTQTEILALRAAGTSFNAIAAALNKRGLKGPQGGRWYGATIARMVHSARAPHDDGK